jgi:hypothetical protein
MHGHNSSEKSDIVFSPAVPTALRAEVREHHALNCHRCGLAHGEIDWTTGRRARLHVGYLIDKSLGGADDLSNLRAACSICIQGRKAIAVERPTGSWLLSQVRGAGQEEQLEVLNRLRKKFKDR